MEIVYLFIAGALGAFIKDIVEDGSIVLPKKVDGKYALGFIGSMLIGGFVGWAIDGSVLVAALSGFTGLSAIENLIQKKPKCKVE